MEMDAGDGWLLMRRLLPLESWSMRESIWAL
ncbi:hypothetical protein F383_31926 [Gossypium arboreum]|uniref:Uncharacterized protein n=1 Tax=Gossypium arboreum TaxID=29729 RepID=A0A0B0MZ49_GOSAR|nr:hypothetical protein F383_31926 [Gossypium arboreum]